MCIRDSINAEYGFSICAPLQRLFSFPSSSSSFLFGGRHPLSRTLTPLTHSQLTQILSLIDQTQDQGPIFSLVSSLPPAVSIFHFGSSLSLQQLPLFCSLFCKHYRPHFDQYQQQIHSLFLNIFLSASRGRDPFPNFGRSDYILQDRSILLIKDSYVILIRFGDSQHISSILDLDSRHLHQFQHDQSISDGEEFGSFWFMKSRRETSLLENSLLQDLRLFEQEKRRRHFFELMKQVFEDENSADEMSLEPQYQFISALGF
eukprot:TRINITY_DN4558_c0_g1_i1.p1 TRINITY_DN4558_c0_g1~~TRINITY_DN4558_c0_g1_i1.p1  ORF type:complete len:260 (+),score=54.60 TRINITY_DN4558_c0_g1_i1:32-811(+)